MSSKPVGKVDKMCILVERKEKYWLHMFVVLIQEMKRKNGLKKKCEYKKKKKIVRRG